tara:strand:- start:3176 stop:3532 length:357 start_codon:yes stop_codon:yes gene_type:complete
MGKPCLGYKTRTAAVLALQAQSVSDREIARRIGIEIKTVSALAASAARQRKLATEREAGVVRTGLVLPVLTRSALRPAAAARSVSVDRLALMILEAVGDSGLADAVLDDGIRSERRDA